MQEDDSLTEHIERRHYPRLQKNLTMRYSLAEEELSTDFNSDAEILDIGGGGIRFLAPRKLAKNTQLLISLPLREWRKDKINWPVIFPAAENGELNILGKVMWAAASKEINNSFETGVRFIGRIESGKGDNL